MSGGLVPQALMIFAAGFGRRMAPLTDTRPKPLLQVGGQTLLDRAIALGRAGGARRIAVNSHYLGDQIGAHLQGTGIAHSPEPGQILDTGGGLKRAVPLLGPGAVMTLNPDAVWTGPNPLAALRAAWDPARMGALLMTIPVDRAAGRSHQQGGRGDFALDAAGRISRGGPMLYCGAQIIDPAVLDRIEDESFSLNRAWDLLAGEGRLYGLTHPGGWCDVGTPQGIDLAESLLEGAHV